MIAWIIHAFFWAVGVTIILMLLSIGFQAVAFVCGLIAVVIGAIGMGFMQLISWITGKKIVDR